MDKGIEYEELAQAFDKYYPRLLVFARHFVSSEAQAKDIVQDSFVKLWEKRDEYTGFAVSSLLYTIVRNKCFDELKHRLVASEFKFEDFKNKEDLDQLYNFDFYGSQDNPTLYGELVRSVRKAIDRLPERTREVFRLSRFDNMTNREIARMLGISDTAVHKHIAKALVRIEKTLK